MGRGVLAAGMAGSEPGLGAGDTFGISCVCSQTPSGTGSDSRFLVFHCLFHYQDHGRISSGSSFGNPAGSSGGRGFPGASASGAGSADNKVHSRSFLCDPGPDLGAFGESLSCDLFSYGISCYLYQCAQRHRKHRQETSGEKDQHGGMPRTAQV